MNYKSLLLLSVLSFSQPISAANTQEEPLKCPSISSLIAEGVHDAGIGTLGWMAFNISHYDTSDEWTFGLFVPATDKESAIEMGNTNIKSLTSVQGPVEPEKGVWGCIYMDATQEIFGVSVTPSLDVDVKRVLNTLRNKF